MNGRPLVDILTEEETTDYLEVEHIFHQKCVYFVQAEGTSLVKIGFTDNLARRMEELTAGSPLPLSILHIIYTERAPDLERELHRQFHQHVHHNEWFALPTSIIKQIQALSGIQTEKSDYGKTGKC